MRWKVCGHRHRAGSFPVDALSIIAASLLLPLWLFCAGLAVAAQDTAAVPDAAPQDAPEARADPLRVGIYASPPFVMKDSTGDYTGMAVDLWEEAAQGLGWNYEYIEQETISDLVEGLESDRLDVGLTNLSVNQERAKRINFTQPWYDGGFRIMIHKEGNTGFWAVVAGLKKSGHLRAYAWICGIIVFATILLTLFDRRFDENFPRRWPDGVAESFYTVMSVTTSGKPPSRKNLFGWVGRIWQGLWLVCGIAVLAYLTSSVTSVMTTLSLTSRINSIADLAGKTVGVRAGSTGEEYALATGLNIHSYDNLEPAVDALRNDRISGLIGDAAVLEYYQHTNPGAGVTVVGDIFSPQSYGFALQKHSEMTKPLTVELLGLKKTGYLTKVNEEYFGSAQ